MANKGPKTPVSEAELHSFVDGELDRDRREAVRAHLAASPQDAARIATWRRQNEAIRAAFGPPDSFALPWPLPHPSKAAHAVDPKKGASEQPPGAPNRHSLRERWFGRAIGFAFGSGALLAATVAYLGDHVTGPEKLGPSLTGPAPSKAIDTLTARALANLRAAGARPAAPVPASSAGSGQAFGPSVLPNIAAEGFRLASVRSFPGDMGETLCLFYAGADRGDLALCAERSFEPGETVFRTAGGSPSAAILWRQSGANYVLAGTLPEAALREVAQQVRGQIAAFDTE